MYALVTGPLFWLSVAVFLGGLAFRVWRLTRLTERREIPQCQVTVRKDDPPAPAMSAEEKKLDLIARFRNSVLGRHPVMTLISAAFHLCLILAPLAVVGHNVLIRRAIGFSGPSLPEWMTDVLTLAVLACGALFLVRRIAVPRVAAISYLSDYAVLLITVTPFVTGFLAHHQLLAYRPVITAHALAGDLMLMAIPFTKIGHMVFFFFARLTIAGEYCLGRGTRVWAMPSAPGKPSA
jgi:hypothetical protein